MTLFLVEDSPQILQRLEVLLRAVQGVEIVGHSAGADESIQQILALLPDAVVLDLNLAQGSGIDVLRAIRRHAPQTDVFVLTNFTTAQYRRACVGLGAKGFFDKSREFTNVRDAISASAQQRIHNY
jgi:DNA-binding NarL/FixJ family response regulator